MRTVLSLLLALILSSTAYAQAVDRNLVPKYGSAPKTEAQKASDEVFLRAMDEAYQGDRKKAADDTATRGWQFLAQGDKASAMRRFNQAWLLDTHNGFALWGMGAVEASLDHFDSSLSLFLEAEKLLGDAPNFNADFAKAIGMAVQLNDPKLLAMAFSRFEHTYQKAPKNVDNLQNWAIVLFMAGNDIGAWSKVKLAESVPGGKPLNPQFLSQLQARTPRPRD